MCHSIRMHLLCVHAYMHLVHTGLQFLASVVFRSCFGVAAQLGLAVGVKGPSTPQTWREPSGLRLFSTLSSEHVAHQAIGGQ